MVSLRCQRKSWKPERTKPVDQADRLGFDFQNDSFVFTGELTKSFKVFWKKAKQRGRYFTININETPEVRFGWDNHTSWGKTISNDPLPIQVDSLGIMHEQKICFVFDSYFGGVRIHLVMGRNWVVLKAKCKPVWDFSTNTLTIR